MRLFRNKRGQGMTEYIIIVAVVAIAAIAAFKIFGTKVTGSINKVGTDMQKETGTGDNGQ